MSDKTFSVVFVLKVDEANNILSSYNNAHEDDIYDLITDIMYDVDDVEINNLLVKERQ
jgi:hypothetical protein|tara:strand:- start:1219 stop:1392 length:174 start_codon:yes stop_codon:yes gene_type:complete